MAMAAPPYSSREGWWAKSTPNCMSCDWYERHAESDASWLRVLGVCRLLTSEASDWLASPNVY